MKDLADGCPHSLSSVPDEGEMVNTQRNRDLGGIVYDSFVVCGYF